MLPAVCSAPIPGTQAEAYLRARGITGRLDWVALRFHPRVWYRETETASLEAWPALFAAVTDPGGRITGIQRTWLDRSRPDKAPITDLRRALGHLLGNGVRFGEATDLLVAGEGIETVLALKSILPALPMIAALSANHLAALDLPPTPGSGPGQACMGSWLSSLMTHTAFSPGVGSRCWPKLSAGRSEGSSPAGAKDRATHLYGELVVKPDDAHCVFSRCRVSVLAKAQCRTIRGELASGREGSRYTLVFGRSAWTSTMMQSCASAAKLRDGRPIL